MKEEIRTEAPRLTPEQIQSVISDEQYYIFPGTTVTACLLTLKNGYSVLGKSATISMDFFNEEIGRKIAREDAVKKIWDLEGYLLKQKLMEAQAGNQLS